MDIFPIETEEEWNWIKEKFDERKYGKAYLTFFKKGGV